MRFLAVAICMLAMASRADEEVVAWRGAALSGWKGNSDCADVRVEDDILKGRITGRDSQLCANVPVPFFQKGNHVVYVKVRVAHGGVGQFFWLRDCDSRATEAQRCNFDLATDGSWRRVRLLPCWGGTNRIARLRLDFPATAIGQEFEVESVVVGIEGEELAIDTQKMIGVTFSLQMPPGVHYCSLTWGGSTALPGGLGFTPATDGRRHTYWLDLRNARVRQSGPHRGRPSWVGTVCRFGVEQVRQSRLLPVEDFVFCEQRPYIPADVTITSARASEAIPRAGRNFPLEVILRNFGTESSERIELAFDGLPAGVHLVDPAEAGCVSIDGSDGAETIGFDCRDQLCSERVLRPCFTDLGVGHHVIGVILKVGGKIVQRVEAAVDVKPSLALAKVDYPSPPTKIDTSPYEIGAFLFPGWVPHRWHAIWSHAPWRKPVLGWYDETSPETVDWQIKHLVENGVSHVFVDWYWAREQLGMHHWMDSFAKARYRGLLKWSVMWANHNGTGMHYEADQEKVTQYWIDNYFSDPQYMRIDGMPVVTIWSTDNMESDMRGKGGCKALLDISQRLARAAGYKGIYFVAVRHLDGGDADYLRSFAEMGFRRTCVYKYIGEIPGASRGADGSRPYSFLAETSLDHWRWLGKNGTLPFMPSLTTAWDDRPWRGELGWEITNINACDFRRICADARRYSDESGERLLMMGPLDEWGEGSIGYPNAEHGFDMLEAVRETFGKKPADGWPVNHAPEDVGLSCPQRLGLEDVKNVTLDNVNRRQRSREQPEWSITLERIGKDGCGVGEDIELDAVRQTVIIDRLHDGTKRFTCDSLTDGCQSWAVRVVLEQRERDGGCVFVGCIENNAPGIRVITFKGPFYDRVGTDPALSALYVPQGFGRRVRTFPTASTTLEPIPPRVRGNPGVSWANGKWYASRSGSPVYLTGNYPGATGLTMPWYALDGDGKGVYAGVHDTEARPKRMFIKYDIVNAFCNLGFAHDMYLEAGQKWTLAETVFAPYKGDWHVAAKKYRAWYDTVRSVGTCSPAWTKSFSGWLLVIMKQQNEEIFWSYSDIPKLCDIAEANGLDCIGLFGWTKGGHDHLYPDYDPDTKMGGVTALKEGIAEAHRRGIRVWIYANGQLQQVGATNYWDEHGKDNALVCGNGEMVVQNYHKYADIPKYDFSLSCLWTKSWYDRMLSLAYQAESFGADGILYDQLGIFSPFPCWGKGHGHAAPGYSYATERPGFIRRIADTIRAKNSQFAVLTEGLHDTILDSVATFHGCSYGTYPIDLPDVMRRITGGKAEVFPELWRYTFPELVTSTRVPSPMSMRTMVNYTAIFGFRHDIELRYGPDRTWITEGKVPTQGDYGTVIDKPDIKWMQTHDPKTAARYLKAVNLFSRKHAKYLIRGRFVDDEGFTCSTAGVIAKRYVATDGSSAVLVWNPSDKVSANVNIGGIALSAAYEPEAGCVEVSSPLAPDTLRLYVL